MELNRDAEWRWRDRTDRLVVRCFYLSSFPLHHFRFEVAFAPVVQLIADTPLTLDLLPHMALLRNYSNDFAAPDQAAAATAIATGVNVNNRLIGCDSEGKPLPTLIEIAHRAGRATGLVTNANLTDPTTASFSAHTVDQNDKAAIARQIAENSNLDLVLGGGADDFLPEAKGGNQPDDRDLLLEVRRNGFDLVLFLGGGLL